jgi:hypothetical protein
MKMPRSGDSITRPRAGRGTKLPCLRHLLNRKPTRPPSRSAPFRRPRGPSLFRRKQAPVRMQVYSTEVPASGVCVIAPLTEQSAG